MVILNAEISCLSFFEQKIGERRLSTKKAEEVETKRKESVSLKVEEKVRLYTRRPNFNASKTHS